jgi:hypothetical protein
MFLFANNYVYFVISLYIFGVKDCVETVNMQPVD